jgi:hypothetical protein
VQCRLASTVLGGDVETDRLGVVGKRFDVLDDVTLAGMGRDLSNGEIGRAIAPGPPQELGLVPGLDTSDEAEAASPGKLPVDVPGDRIGTEGLAREAFRAYAVTTPRTPRSMNS